MHNLDMESLTHIEIDPNALRAARGEKTQEEAGALVGVTGGQISRYELGQDAPSGNVLLRLMLAFDVSASDLASENFLKKNSSSA